MVLRDIFIKKKKKTFEREDFRMKLLLSLSTRLFAFVIPVNHEHYSSLDDTFARKKDVNEDRSAICCIFILLHL